MSTLHITNGDCAADTLRQVVDGSVAVTIDVLYEGPVPRVEGDAWYLTRARGGAGSRSASLPVERDERDEIVLWFEHDLYDQLLLIRALSLLSSAVPKQPGPRDALRVSLICIDRFPGVARFIGLGQLTAGQLATLVDTRRPVTTEQYALATAAWDAFRSPDPRDLLALTVQLKPFDSPLIPAALPFLGDALWRFFAEFPSVTNGLSRTEMLALRGLEPGPTSAGELFDASQALEPRPFMGDWGFYAMLRGLAAAAVPLVTLEAGPDDRDLRTRLVAITDTGRQVLAGRHDHIALNGIDVWRGGVHLEGTTRSPWRWDARGETLVS